MPVADDQALRLAEIEALRAIRDSVTTQAKHTEALTGEVREQGKMIIDVRERLIRIEEGRYGAKVEHLEQEIDELKAAEHRRQGATGFGNWLLKSWPSLVGLIVMALIVLGASGKIKGMG